ncbi:hypothetical protein IEO21_10903 [Rhodonia placenta]|uniref:Uncharacterized protein n=1 Tax=Rhodonia placenta TaxID=104341 RepID=A0A8H7NRV1_9APHY|nr:hypothetical protein IEO21_10903 [Postia placenta]
MFITQTGPPIKADK